MTAPPRYDRLDLVRACAMGLGLVYHATTAWLPDVGPWYFVADDAWPVLQGLSGALHAVRMQVFFALAGFFAHLVFERRGARAFLVDRSRRLLVPLLVAWPLVVLADVALRRHSRALGLMSPAYAPGDAVRWGPLHLWFLVYLWVLSALAVGLPPSPRVRALSRRVLMTPWAWALLAVPTCAGLWLHPENRPDLAWWPQPFELVHYGGFFFFGWQAWAVRRELSALTRFALPVLLLGAVGAAVVFSGSGQWQPWGHVVAGAVAWAVTLGVFGLALRAPATETSPALQFAVESSYWVYLTHYPLVMALQLFFAQRAWPAPLEYAVTVLLTLAVCWLGFAGLVRPTALGPWLGVKAPARR